MSSARRLSHLGFLQQPLCPPLSLQTEPRGLPLLFLVSPGLLLGHIALFLSLGLFSFSIENAKYLKGVGEVSNLKEIIY